MVPRTEASQASRSFTNTRFKARAIWEQLAFHGQSRDGLYHVDVGANNIGYDDQHYDPSVSKADNIISISSWDQTPHLYSTSAQTLYSGLGSGALFCLPGCRTGCSVMPAA